MAEAGKKVEKSKDQKEEEEEDDDKEVPLYMKPQPPCYRGHGVDPSVPTYKIVMMGARGTGKTCLFSQFTYASKASIVITPRTRTVRLDDTKINVEVWDVPGNYPREREEWTLHQSFPNAHGFVVI